ncbi:MAG: hypothetical protein IPJ52_03235 [Rhodocyclaceae bacterium]|nr:hypothetical protein [Rhodocyclaceae bacterium]MBK7813381.1 hypothetical protein [Rhodocyclaceae bacterium]MBK9954212.1 hypothetical protein [Rhodocyclaceae bacterium]
MFATSFSRGRVGGKAGFVCCSTVAGEEIPVAAVGAAGPGIAPGRNSAVSGGATIDGCQARVPGQSNRACTRTETATARAMPKDASPDVVNIGKCMEVC